MTKLTWKLLLFLTMERGGYIYILTNVNRSVLYIGVTSDLVFRLIEHREKVHSQSFTAKYNAIICVYYETFTDIVAAIEREKEIKKWRREKKEQLINTVNPSWKDFWNEVKEW
ncbi:GIY-YIG nuclease family protein [Pedobacter xixiisoli]|uniref:Putative endonuclease n=2 Tax=Pedobacter xixiisoli TaxID=1476464 RepID=A0A286A0B9_9SPHI|nr:GIY-YIG nuclease family protein [Pedobacter xixiisoli]SOD15311.1 putative endonuclease [Pedobacter xixiisoli]